MKTKIAGYLFALVLVVPFFFTTSCSNPSGTSVENEPGTASNFPVTTPPELPKFSPAPLLFFLDEQYAPATEDTGRLGLSLKNGPVCEQVLVSSEDNGNEPVVRIMTADWNDRDTPVFMNAAFYFYDKDSRFPYRCQIERKYGDDSFAIDVLFSTYDERTETFSLTYNGETFNNLVLNKRDFSLHSAAPALDESQNVRIRNALTTLRLWTALVIQSAEWDSAAAALCERSEAVIAALIASLTTGNAVEITTGIDSFPRPMPSKAPLPALITGTPGSGGGTLIDKRDSNFAFDVEIYPYTENTVTYNQASTLRPNFNGTTGWRLPTYEELSVIYLLCLVYDLLQIGQISPLSHEEGNFIWTSRETDSIFAIALDLSAQKKTEDPAVFATNFVPSAKSNRYGAVYVREIR